MKYLHYEMLIFYKLPRDWNSNINKAKKSKISVTKLLVEHVLSTDLTIIAFMLDIIMEDVI